MAPEQNTVASLPLFVGEVATNLPTLRILWSIDGQFFVTSESCGADLEVMVFPADASGTVVEYDEVATFRGQLDHGAAIARAALAIAA